MRIKTFKAGGYTTGGFTSGGGTMTGPLVLAGDPVKDLEAATKQYVDNKVAQFDATLFTSGILQVGRLPAFTGDVTSTTGSNNIALATNGIAAGVYSKVTVNSKGLITAGGGLTESDIPSLDWSKFTSDKPTTLSGYGITDGIGKAGGTVTGNLTLNADPTSANHLVTKQYVDNLGGGGNTIKTGDIVSKMTSATPTGFLKCNGGQVSKTTYSALYTVVGDQYNGTSTVSGAGRPWDQQYEINTTQSAPINAWNYANDLTYYPGQGTGIMLKNKIRLLYANNYYGNEFTATVDASGVASNFSFTNSSTSAPAYSRLNGGIVVFNNFIYFIGGYDNGVANSSNVFKAPINSDGSIGTWVLENNLPIGTSANFCFATNGRLYSVGGVTSGGPSHNNVYTAVINSDGTLGAWSVSSVLPVAMNVCNISIIKNKAYILGFNGSAGASNVIYTATINSDGTLTAFTANGTLPVNCTNGRSYATKNTLYLFVGSDGSSYNLRTTYYAPINADGSLGTWTQGVALPLSLATFYMEIFATSSRLYLVGQDYNNTNRVIYADIVGGTNDTSTYYAGTLAPVNPGNFALPDLTVYDLPGGYSYIKY